MKVKNVMKKAVAIDKDISLKEAAKLMTKNGVGSLIVVHNSTVRGIITEKDITTNADNLSKKVSSVMVKNTITIDYNDEISNAAELMFKNKIKHIPVLKDGELCGIVTATELLENPEDIDDDFVIE